LNEKTVVRFDWLLQQIIIAPSDNMSPFEWNLVRVSGNIHKQITVTIEIKE